MCFSKPKISKPTTITPPPPPAPAESAAAKQGVAETNMDESTSNMRKNKLRIQLASNQGVSGVNIPQ